MILLSYRNSLCASSGQDGVTLVEGDPGLLCAGGSEEGLETFAQRAACSVVVFHCPVLDLLVEAYKIAGYSTTPNINSDYTLAYIKLCFFWSSYI